MAVKLFGFTLGKKDIVQVQAPEQASFALPTESMDDGAVTITQNAHYGTYVDLDGTAKNEVELISRYREMAMQPEIESAIDDIVNEAIVQNDNGRSVRIIMDDLKQPEKIKKAIEEVEKLNNIVKAVFWTRDMINEPVSFLTATQFSLEIKSLLKDLPVTVDVFEKSKIESFKQSK